MKKSLKTLVYLLIAVPILFIGCKKSDLTDGSNPSTSVEKASPAYCGTPVVKKLYTYGADNTIYGDVTVGNDLYNLYVTIHLSGDWVFWNDGFASYEKGCHLFVGSEAELLALNENNVVNHDADLTGYFAFYDFNYHTDGTELGTQTYSFIVPRTSISVNCPIIVAGASIKNTAGDLKLVSAKQELKHNAYWFSYCMQTCTTNSGTAYAYGESVATCFTAIPNIASNNWGWTNKIGQGTYDWPIYAGAGLCSTDKGTLVGTLHVVYATGTATITYIMNAGVSLDGTHVSVFMNPKMLPKNSKGQYITSPGQFPYTGNPVTVTGLTGDIWIAAHAGVSW